VLLVGGAALADAGFDERFVLYSRRSTGSGGRRWRVRYCSDVVAFHSGAGIDADGFRREFRFYAGNERCIREWFGQRR